MKRKILAAFILAFIAIVLALGITHFSFREMMGTVDQLSAPNEKLAKLNKVFEEITTLDQQQRAEAIENPEKPYKYFLDQSGYLQLMIDSLQTMPWDDVQKKRLRSLTSILNERNELFVSYLKVKAELADNKEFSRQLDTLSILLKQNQASGDSSIITTQKKTITTYLQDSARRAKADKGFLKKLFSRKKSKTPETPVVREELKVTVDTLKVAKQGLGLEEIRKIMSDLESDQMAQRRKLQSKELELIHANTLFINQLLNTLHEVENEELLNIKRSNQHASKVVSSTINRMNMVMLAFFLAAAVLVYLIFIDISRSNYYRKQLEKARDQAEELSSIKQRFLANMSHEIRTPLQSIIGFAEQLKQEKNPQIKESIDAIHSSSEHLLQIVNEVLDYSRISSGTFTLAHDNFNLLKLIRDTEAAMRVQAERKKLTLIVDTEQTVDYNLEGDPFRLRQILYNLLGNAIKFTTEGFIKLHARTYENEGRVRTVFEITDTGIGMSGDEIKRIFNQFEQANSDIHKHFGGTGLGLTIVKALIDVQNGELAVTSEPGKGSTFKVTLSFSKVPAPSLTVPKKKETSVSPDRINAIVIDDDAMILKLCALILRKNNVRHTTFDAPEKLLKADKDASVTHIFIDIRMPQMNGTELCKKLKASYPRETKFIALTAHVLPNERDGLLADGFDIVLTKPFHESELMNVLGLARTSEKLIANLPDFSLVRQMTMGDEILFQTVMQQFVEDSDEDAGLLKDGLSSRDRKAVREVVHKLAGRFGQMGIFSLSARLHDIEVQLVDGKSVEELSAEIRDVVREIKEILQSIRLTTIEHLN